MKNKLPQGWVECVLGDVLYLQNGYAFNSKDYCDNGICVIRISDIQNNKVNTKNAVKYNKMDIGKCYIVENGDFLLAMSGATTGKTGVYCEKSPAYLNQRVGNLKIYSQKVLCQKYRNYYIMYKRFAIEKKAYGGAQPNISKQMIESLRLLLPPLNEQRRIVGKIEEEFGKIDEGVEKLRFALEQIKQYRQAVLKSAFDGKLYKTTEWKEKSLQELTLKIGDVDHKMPKEVKEGVPYISPKDFYGVNGIDFINAKKITKKDYKILSKKIAPNYGDIIFPRYGTIGTLRYVDTEEQFLVSYSCVVIKTINEKAESKYLYYSLLSPQIKSQIQRSIRQTTQANIGIQSIKDFKIKIGIKAEQQQIVKEIEKRLKVADRIEAVIRQNLDKAEQLKQSILKKAFEGRLVPQDPNDEPASVLLEKIKAERKNKCLIS